jgi:hypothetical protein
MMGGGGSFSAGGPGKGMFSRLYLNVLNRLVPLSQWLSPGHQAHLNRMLLSDAFSSSCGLMLAITFVQAAACPPQAPLDVQCDLLPS